MKAIKLASVFAVSAIAAAVSTTTIAAEPTFKGQAGLEYQSTKDGKDQANSHGEVNIIGTVGSVYFALDMTKNHSNEDSSFRLDEIYVTQGAVQFGDFDGTLADAAAYSAGVKKDLDTAKYDLGSDLGIRYAVNDDLKVSLEVKEGQNKGSLGFSYSTKVDVLTLGLSGAFQLSEGGDNNVITAGLKAPLGMATLSTFVQVGSIGKSDVMNTGFGIDMPLTEQLSLAAQYYTQGGEVTPGQEAADEKLVAGDDIKKAGVTEVTATYKVGDVRYYASVISFEDSNRSDYSVIGAKVTF